MRPNIVIVGDSFCSSSSGWPSLVAQALDLELICHGAGGQSWWNARDFLDKLDTVTRDNTRVVVFVHTNADRIPTDNTEIGLIDHSAAPTTEIETAVQLYYKYIHDPKFLAWAQHSWFAEINQQWANTKTVHLHSFPWSVTESQLSGLTVITNLASISLNELGAEQFVLYNDPRPNHLNDHNNRVLAQQLSQLIQAYQPGSVSLDTDQFDLKTRRWFDWH